MKSPALQERSLERGSPLRKCLQFTLLSLLLFSSLSMLATAGQTNITAEVKITKPENLTLTNLSSAQQVPYGSQFRFAVGLRNPDEYPATNIILNISITGPEAYNALLPLQSLLPGQSSNTSILLSGFATMQGSYLLSAIASYHTGNLINVTNLRYLSFSVSGQPRQSVSSAPAPQIGSGGVSAPQPLPVTTLPGLSLSAVPVSTSAIIGQGTYAQLDLVSNSSYGENVSFSVNKNFSGLLSLSQSHGYLPPGGNLSVQAIFKSSANTTPGTYIIPVNVSVSPAPGGHAKYETIYLEFSLYQNSYGIQLLGQSYLLNSSSVESGIIEIINNGNTTINNATLSTLLPLHSARNLSSITAYGIPNNITFTSEGYSINWQVSSLPRKRELTAYYSIYKPSDIAQLIHPENIFTEASPIVPSSVMRVLDLGASPFYPNSSGYIYASLLYTGTSSASMDIYLTGPSGFSISSPSAIFNVTPNQEVSKKFYINVGNSTGTSVFYLYVSAGGYNSTYSIPVVILPSESGAIQSPAASSSNPPISSLLPAMPYALSILLISSLAYIAYMHYLRKPKINPEKAKELSRLRERIRRETDE